MGRMKELLIERQEQADDRVLANIIGITYEDLIKTDYKIESDESNDGLVYQYRIVFSDSSPREILNKIERLEKDNRTVTIEPWEFDVEIDYDEQFNAIITNVNHRKKFNNEIENLKQVNEITLDDPKLEKILKRQIFISVIGTMETFLSDTFIKLTFDDQSNFRRFIETHPEFKKQKFELREIFSETQKLKEIAKKVMLDTIYHNLPTIKEMFTKTFEIQFPDIKDVYKLVIKRHDLVHRNGKTKDGKEIQLDKPLLIV